MFENLWELIWFSFSLFLLFAYLMVMFNIIVDIFRDGELNGWLKALWVLLLIFLPFITALVYLIARGNGMARRSVKDIREREEAASAYIRSVASSKSIPEQLDDAHKLHDAGKITDEEYASLKAKLIS